MAITEANLPDQLGLARLPRDDDELWWTVKALWGFGIPRTKVCPNHVAPFTAFADAYFARSNVAVWKASRGFGGKTNTLSTLVLTEAALLGAQTTILGGSGAQSLNVHNTTKEAWAHHWAPRNLLDDEPTKYDTQMNHGGSIRSLTASQTSVRGPHPQRLRLDEIDEMDVEILHAAQGQPMRKRRRFGMVETQTVMSSTHQYPDGTMTAMLAMAKEKEWPVFEWCWRETSNPIDGWLTADEVERKRGEIPQAMWDAEYDLQEPSFEGRAMDSDKVEAAFNTFWNHLPGEGEEYTYEDDEVFIEGPQDDRRYVTGVDWAKENDWTIIATFDATDDDGWICVAWKKVGRLPWPVMTRMAYDRWRTYGGTLVHDSTGVGDVVHDDLVEYLEDEFGHNSFEAQKWMKSLDDVILGGGRARHDLFSDYIAGIESGAIMYPRIAHAYDEHRFCRVDDLYGSGHPPDSVIAGAVAWKHRESEKPTRVLPITLARESPWTL